MSKTDHRVWVSSICRDLGITATELARRAGLPSSTLTRLINGSTKSLRGSSIAAIEKVEGRPALREDPAEFDHELRSEAKSLGLDPHAIARKAVEDAVKRKRIDAWIEDNREAMEANAKDLRENGLWSDGYRLF